MQKSRFSFRVNLCFGLAASVLIFWLLIHVPQIFEDFLQNIIWSGAYIGIAKGLAVTLLLTVTGVLLGTLFGIIFCTFRNSRILALRTLGQALIEILRGTPVVMLLMFLYFCVFINLKIEALMVAMIGYGLNSGAHMAEIFRTSLDAVNIKETEAARMLGFSKLKAFFYITLPQSWKVARPVYQSSVISLIQWTTVAGYISVSELTRMINGLGSRTGNPFYALFVGILLYLTLAYIIKWFFWIEENRGHVK